ncbi:hypothetical protein BTB_c33520 [Bacillus thuringiensis Bt407]|uniref:Uncharacterized protein n=1 Tax=Bacillus thuringiensis T01-328 TaxID=1324966 RepID=A0AAN4KN27_BACTU|nr:hypothetical protein BTB_c33520 [Bacillus thuringiensis Bt407]ERH98254.1 hypothetical protein BTCBT_005593 [Bacillus thuringiensis T01-328]
MHHYQPKIDYIYGDLIMGNAIIKNIDTAIRNMNTTAVKVLSSKISLYCPLVSTLLSLSKDLKTACTSLLLDVVSNFT